MRIENGPVDDRALDALAAILAGCVDGGASIGFLRGFPLSVDGTLEPTTYMHEQLDRRRS